MIYIISHNYSYTNLILGELEEKGLASLIAIKPLTKSKRIFYKFINNLCFNKITPLLFDKDAKKRLSQITGKDTVVLFDYLAVKNVKYIIKKTNARKFHFWYWNTVNRKTKKSLNFRNSKNIDTYFHTFDPGDAKKYNMILQNQIFSEEIIKNLPIKNNPTIDFFFIGKDKGRMAYLSELNTKLRNWGFKTRFIVLSKKHDNKPCEGLEIINREVPYDDVLQMIGNSKAIVDITKDSQTGLTLRCLEGIFLGKKVLTDNDSVKTLPFYDENIFMITKDISKEKLENFLANNMEISSESKKDFSVEFWLKNIIASEN